MYKENIFEKLLQKIKLVFIKSTEQKFKTENSIDYPTAKTNLLKCLKVDLEKINNKCDKKNFMKNLADNIDLLENFSNDRLEKILQYYLAENQKKREVLKNLKHNSIK